MFTEPTPPKAQITWNEQRRIIRAALSVLHPVIAEIRPNPADTMTLATHLEITIADALGDTYAVDAVPRLFQDMAEAAIAELLAVSSDRGALP
jgi:hypothetical protein